MGCIKASDYVLAGGSGLILGTYTGPDPSGDCEQDCGICCIPPDNTCWMCDCTFNRIGSTNKLNCIDFVGDNTFYYDEDCAALPYYERSNCVLEASIGIGADFWAGEECPYVIYTPEGSEIIHRGSNPAGNERWAYLPDGRLMVFDGLGYPGQPYWTSNDTYMCDCFYGQEVRYDWYDETGRNQETRAFRLWQVDCSGNFTNVTSLYIDSVLSPGCFEWDDYNVTDGILTSPIPSGVDVFRPTSKPSIGDCIVVFDGDSGYPSYTPVPMPDEFWSLVDGEPTICLGREGAPDYTCLPDGSGYCTIDQLPKVDFTCNDTISKSGCISGGVISPSGVAAGTWFAGLNCEVANSGYGGCSGLMQM